MAKAKIIKENAKPRHRIKLTLTDQEAKALVFLTSVVPSGWEAARDIYAVLRGVGVPVLLASEMITEQGRYAHLHGGLNVLQSPQS